MDWTVEIADGENWPNFTAEKWTDLLVKVYKGQYLLHEKAQMHDPLLCDHIESGDYGSEDKDLYEAINRWQHVLWEHNNYEIITPDNADALIEAQQRKDLASAVYEEHIGYLEGLYHLRSLFDDKELEIEDCESQLATQETPIEILPYSDVQELDGLEFDAKQGMCNLNLMCRSVELLNRKMNMDFSKDFDCIQVPVNLFFCRICMSKLSGIFSRLKIPYDRGKFSILL